MANLLFNGAKTRLLNGGIDLDTDTIRVMLLTSAYTPNIDTQTFYSDISANEVTGTGYTAGGAALTGAAVTQDNTNDLAYFDANDTSWTNSTITARYAVIYKSTGTGSTSPLIAYIDFGVNRSSSTDTFYISWATTGILALA